MRITKIMKKTEFRSKIMKIMKNKIAFQNYDIIENIQQITDNFKNLDITKKYLENHENQKKQIQNSI